MASVLTQASYGGAYKHFELSTRLSEDSFAAAAMEIVRTIFVLREAKQHYR
jgi:hypothetical protein